MQMQNGYSIIETSIINGHSVFRGLDLKTGGLVKRKFEKGGVVKRNKNISLY